jgi:hypothetical protein
MSNASLLFSQRGRIDVLLDLMLHNLSVGEQGLLTDKRRLIIISSFT